MSLAVGVGVVCHKAGSMSVSQVSLKPWEWSEDGRGGDVSR